MLDHSVDTQEVTGGSALMDILCVITSVADPNLVKSRIRILSLQKRPRKSTFPNIYTYYSLQYSFQQNDFLSLILSVTMFK